MKAAIEMVIKKQAEWEPNPEVTDAYRRNQIVIYPSLLFRVPDYYKYTTALFVMIAIRFTSRLMPAYELGGAGSSVQKILRLSSYHWKDATRNKGKKEQQEH
eukprot:1194586-Prorocentrum_minimum.AAC.5